MNAIVRAPRGSVLIPGLGAVPLALSRRPLAPVARHEVPAYRPPPVPAVAAPAAARVTVSPATVAVPGRAPMPLAGAEPRAAPPVVAQQGLATTVGIQTGPGTTLTSTPADLTVTQPQTDITNFTIVSLDAGSY